MDLISKQNHLLRVVHLMLNFMFIGVPLIIQIMKEHFLKKSQTCTLLILKRSICGYLSNELMMTTVRMAVVNFSILH